MFRFIHSADLHLGKPFGRFPEEVRGALRQARAGVLGRLAAAARDGGAGHVLIAGDLFDAITPAPTTIRQAVNAMAEADDLTWIILPGNHDHLGAPLWEQFDADLSANIRRMRDDTPLELARDVQLLPAPVPARRPGRDLTDALDAATPEGALRIGLAHGAVHSFGEEPDVGMIRPDRAARSGLDYLALGDWHRQMQITPGTWYAGTPETDSFRHQAPAAALLVSVTRGRAPEVTPVETGEMRWLDAELAATPGHPPR